MADETPAPLSDAEIAEIAERAAKATPGPWGCWPHYIGGMVVGRKVADGGPGAIVEVFEPERYGPQGWRGPNQPEPDFMPNTAFLMHARTDIPRLLATIVAYREIVAAVAGDHVHQWDAVDPQEVWACEVCGEYSHDWAEEVQQRARALLGTSTPEGEDS